MVNKSVVFLHISRRFPPPTSRGVTQHPPWRAVCKQKDVVTWTRSAAQPTKQNKTFCFWTSSRAASSGSCGSGRCRCLGIQCSCSSILHPLLPTPPFPSGWTGGAMFQHLSMRIDRRGFTSRFEQIVFGFFSVHVLLVYMAWFFQWYNRRCWLCVRQSLSLYIYTLYMIFILYYFLFITNQHLHSASEKCFAVLN